MKLSCVVIVGLLLITPCVKSQQQSAFAINSLQELRQFFYGQHVKYPLISAHRGGPGVGYPENALETFRHTAAQGAFIIEFDVALSKDSALVLMHDNTLDRTTTGNGPISAKTNDELQILKLKDKGGKETNFKIPLLEEALDWGKGKAIFTIDVKRGVPFSKIIAAVRKKQAESFSVIITYNANQAAEVHQLAPDLMISASIRSKEDLDRLNNAGVPDSCLVAFVGTSEPDSAVYSLLKARGITAMMGTMGNLDRQAEARGAEVYYNLVKRGAQALSTDAPEIAYEAIGKWIDEQQITSPFVRHRIQTQRKDVDTTQQIDVGRINKKL